jgi:uncharacterized membrane protein
MSKVVREIVDDLSFIRSHTLQPQWYKVFKVFLILGFLVGYYFLFGVLKTILFFVVFIILSLGVHMAYRVNTQKWTRSWLDFVVTEEDGEPKATSIGKFYYAAVIVNLLVSLVISQAFG